jgi:small multidrug resistance pump
MKWLIILFGIASNAAASILLKVAVTPPYSFPSLKDPLAALRNGPFWLGLTCYGMAFVLYAAALSRFPLNVAHPILTSGAIAAVAVASAAIFREPFPRSTLLGIVLVTIGVALIATGTRR